MVKFKRAWLSQSNLDFMTTRIVWSIHFYLLGDTFGMIFPPRRCYKIFSNLMLLPRLTLFFSMFPFDSPENIRKPLVFWCFQGNQKRTLRRKRIMSILHSYRKQSIDLHWTLLAKVLYFWITTWNLVTSFLCLCRDTGLSLTLIDF